MHIAFLEMIIDPVCSMVFEAEAEESDVMARPPRAAETPLLSASLIAWSLLQGVAAFLVLAALYVLAIRNGLPEEDARALTFVSLVVINFGLVLVNRSYGTSLRELIGHRNRSLLYVAAAALLILGGVFASAPGRAVFRFGVLHADDLMVVVVVVVVVVAALEGIKRLLARPTRERASHQS